MPAAVASVRQVACKAEIEHGQIAGATVRLNFGALYRVAKSPVFRIASARIHGGVPGAANLRTNAPLGKSQ